MINKFEISIVYIRDKWVKKFLHKDVEINVCGDCILGCDNGDIKINFMTDDERMFFPLLHYFQKNILIISASSHFGESWQFENNFLKGNFESILIDLCTVNELLIFRKMAEICMANPFFQNNDELLTTSEFLSEINSKFIKKMNEMDCKNSRFKKDLYSLRRNEFNKKSPQLKILLIERDGHKCNTCNAELHLTIDHIIPLSRGGSDNIENLQLLCRSCNSQKNNKRLSYEPIPQEKIKWSEISKRVIPRGAWK